MAGIEPSVKWSANRERISEIFWWIAPITGGIAAWRFFGMNSTGLAWVAVVVGLAGLWTAGIANNFQRGEEHLIPDLAVKVNLGATLAGIGVLALSFVL